MNEVIAHHPDREIHVILSPSVIFWLARHKTVHFHYTPTHSSHCAHDHGRR